MWSAWPDGPCPLFTGPAASAIVKISKRRWTVPSGRVRRAAPKACTGPYTSSTVKSSNSTTATRFTEGVSATARLLETILEGAFPSHLVHPDLLQALTTTEKPQVTVRLQHHLGRLRVRIVVDGRHRGTVRSGAAHHDEVTD